MLRVHYQMVRIIRIIHLQEVIINLEKVDMKMIDLPACVAGSRLPINNLVLTTFTGPLIVRIWNCE